MALDSRNRVFLVEDDLRIVHGIKRLLEPIAVVEVATREDAAIRELRTRPAVDLILVDVGLGADDRAGLRVLDVAAEMLPDVKRALLTGSRDAAAMWHAAKRGAAFLPKPFEPNVLMELASGPFPKRLAKPDRQTLDAFTAARCAEWRVVGRQARVVMLSVAGRSRAQIADELGVGETTIATYSRRILEKTGHPSQSALAADVLRRYGDRT